MLWSIFIIELPSNRVTMIYLLQTQLLTNTPWNDDPMKIRLKSHFMWQELCDRPPQSSGSPTTHSTGHELVTGYRRSDLFHIPSRSSRIPRAVLYLGCGGGHTEVHMIQLHGTTHADLRACHISSWNLNKTRGVHRCQFLVSIDNSIDTRCYIRGGWAKGTWRLPCIFCCNFLWICNYVKIKIKNKQHAESQSLRKSSIEAVMSPKKEANKSQQHHSLERFHKVTLNHKHLIIVNNKANSIRYVLTSWLNSNFHFVRAGLVLSWAHKTRTTSLLSREPERSQKHVCPARPLHLPAPRYELPRQSGFSPRFWSSHNTLPWQYISGMPFRSCRGPIDTRFISSESMKLLRKPENPQGIFFLKKKIVCIFWRHFEFRGELGRRNRDYP